MPDRRRVRRAAVTRTDSDSATAARMSQTALTVVINDRIWSLDRPVWFGGVRLRARTTVLRLDGGGLLLHTPAPPTDAYAEQLRALGPVR